MVAEDSAALLNHHFYTVEAEGIEVYRGLIVETGQNFRRAQGFESLKDLFDSLVANIDPEANGKLVLHSSLRDAELMEEDIFLPDEPALPEELSYFRLFYAMKQFRQRLLESSESPERLQKWLLVYPGCLEELAGKVREEIKGQTFQALHWFMAHEVNATRRLARQLCDALDEKMTLAEHQWDSMCVKVPRLPKKEGAKTREFLGYIASTSGYKENTYA